MGGGTQFGHAASAPPATDLSLTGLRVVVEVAGTGSITRAAAALGYTQSAVSRQVAAVERALGTPLFERRARGVEPTAAGAVLAAHAADVLRRVEAAAQEIAGLHAQVAGRITLGAFPSAQPVLVPAAVARLRTAHPGLVVRLAEDSTPKLLRRLRARQLDVAVVAVGAELPTADLADLETTVLGRGHQRIAVADGHRLAALTRLRREDLIDEPWIVGAGEAGDPQFGAWPTLAEPRVAYAVRSWPSRLGLVACGLGITVVPEIAAGGVPAGVRVLEVDDPSELPRTLLAVTRPEPGAAVGAAVDALLLAAR